MDVRNLGVAWQWNSPSPPRPAWGEPPRWDAWRGVSGLRSMRNFDPVFFPVIADGTVFFVSSADDSVHALDAKTGQTRWTFTTDGPVRIAPTVDRGRVYFGSDDGFAYCVDARDGTLVWKFSPAPNARMLWNDGRLISTWPVRTTVLVDRGTAYFGASLMPWERSYLCAVDARTGKSTGRGRFVRELNDMTFEGALAATDDHLVVPQGRVSPLLFDRKNGDPGRRLADGGGCFVLITPEDTVATSGKDYRSSGIGVSDQEQSDPKKTVVASFPGATAMVVQGNVSYVLMPDRLGAIDRRKKQRLWEVDCLTPHTLVLAGKTLFAGGDGVVAGYSAKDGTTVWSTEVEGHAYGLAVADGSLFVATDRGAVVCFQEGVGSPATGRTASRDAEPIAENDTGHDQKPDLGQPEPGLWGRWQFTRQGMTGRRMRDREVPGGSIAWDWVGDKAGTVIGDTSIQNASVHLEALRLDGETNSVLLTADSSTMAVPASTITVEAWVRVDRPQAWGGIFSALQDNGSFERGLLLGYRDDRFTFALASKEGPGKLTYLLADTPFENENWYHLVGTYDGEHQRLYLNGELSAESTEQRGAIHHPDRTFLEIGAYHDDDEYFRVRGALHEVAVHSVALDAATIQHRFAERQHMLPAPMELKVGPRVRFRDRTSAVVNWETREPTATGFRIEEQSGTVAAPTVTGTTSETSRTQHEVVIESLSPGRRYTYVIQDGLEAEAGATCEYELDTYFNFSRPDLPHDRGEEGANQGAARIRSHASVNQGLCVVLSDDPDLAPSLARHSELRVVQLATNENAVASMRREWQAAGVYGPRVSAHLGLLRRVPDASVNLIAVPDRTPDRATGLQLARALAPGGELVFPRPDLVDGPMWWENLSNLRATHDDGWIVITRDDLEGAGVWTHQYGHPDNSAFGGETLAGATTREQFDAQWLGRPGPRYQSDRQNRKPSPLAVNGRLFLQGLGRILALDAYNGTILWTHEIPDFQRSNIPRDSSNWCADDDAVYAVVKDRCLRIDAATGDVVEEFIVPAPRAGADVEWGYVGQADGLLYGTSTMRGSPYTAWWGNIHWYDQVTGPLTHKVMGEHLFAKDPKSGAERWRRDAGLIFHATICIAEGRLHFVETRNAGARSDTTSRLGPPDIWEDLFLVSLDAQTGEVVYERPLDCVAGVTLFNLSCGEGALVLVSSAEKAFHVYAYEAATGEPRWNQKVAWPKADHGAHLSRAVLTGGRVYVRPAVWDLKTGALDDASMSDFRGCSTYIATADALVYRDGAVTLWDPDTGVQSKWDRLRPDCWISTIPACGMLLSPEAGGGCSCGSWMEMSVGFMPRR